jgi:hypothetical protein
MKADCVSLNWHAFFKCGIKIGLRFRAKPHRKNKEVIKIMAKPLLCVFIE